MGLWPCVDSERAEGSERKNQHWTSSTFNSNLGMWTQGLSVLFPHCNADTFRLERATYFLWDSSLYRKEFWYIWYILVYSGFLRIGKIRSTSWH